MAYLNHKVTKAMTQQVNRVNMETMEALRQRLDEALRRNEYLEEENRRLKQLNGDGDSATATWKGRPVFTIAEAAARAGLSYHIAYRYVVKEKYWEGDQRDSGEWVVYADQVLTRRPKKKRTKKK